MGSGVSEADGVPGPARGGIVKFLIVVVILALVAAGLVSLLVGGAWSAKQDSAQREERTRRLGIEAALALAEKGEVLVAEYQKFRAANPDRPWPVRKIEVADLDPTGRLADAEAIVLYGDTLIGSVAPQCPPLSIRGTPELSGDPRVEVLRGRVTRSTQKGNSSVECLQFKAVFPVPTGSPASGSVRILLPLGE